MNIKHAFDNIYVINLNHRYDRLGAFTKESSRIGFTFERFDAYNAGAKGATLSHLNVAMLAKKNKLSNYMVFEDDAILSPDFNREFNRAYYELPKDWDMFLLGFNHEKKPTIITDNINKVNYALALHAMAVNSRFYDKLINCLGNTFEPCDVALAKLHKESNVYCTSMPLVWQADGYSDIEQKDVSYPFLKDTGSLQVYNMGKYSEDFNK